MYFSKFHIFNTVNSWRFQSKIKENGEIQFFAFFELNFSFSVKKDGGNIYNLKALIFSVF